MRDLYRLIANGRASSVAGILTFDPPPDREQPVMTPAERLKLEQELTAARDRQGAAVKAQGGPMKPIKRQGDKPPIR